MKRIQLILAIVLIIVLAVGCACTVKPTPSPSPGIGKSPGIVTSPSVGTSPKVGTSPSAGTSPSVGTSPGTSPGTGIPNFSAGTEVEIGKIPEIKAAVEKKYPGSNILSVVYAMYKNEQVYKVSLTQKDGKVVEINVRPNGTIIDETATTP